MHNPILGIFCSNNLICKRQRAREEEAEEYYCELMKLQVMMARKALWMEKNRKQEYIQ